MKSRRNPDKDKMSRGRFFWYLGEIGLLSFVASIPALGAERATLREAGDSGGDRVFKYIPVRGPTVRGRTFSREALTSRLATKGLEDIRNLVTGRFFGIAAAEAFKDGYTPMINWNLGAGGGDNGCFIHVEREAHAIPDVIDHCCMFMTSYEDQGKLIIEAMSDAASTKIGGAIPGEYECGAKVVPCSPYCPYDCASDCATKCRRWCSTQATVDIFEIVSNPADKFASEIMEIFETDDVATLERELTDLIFSDEVLNMGLEHFVAASHEAYAAKINEIKSIDSESKAIIGIKDIESQ